MGSDRAFTTMGVFDDADDEIKRLRAENERLRAEVESLTGLLAAFDHVPTLWNTATGSYGDSNMPNKAGGDQ